MAGPSLGVPLSKGSRQAVIVLTKQCVQLANQHWDIRTRMEEIDRKYQRETDRTREAGQARRANALGDSTKIQNVELPVVMPQVEAAVTYQASVFLTGTPIFGVVSNPANADAAQQMEAIIQEQQDRGGWVNEFTKAFRDGFKYNIGCLETVWERQVTYTPETDVTFQGGRQGKPKELIWEGNSIRHRSLYNCFWDMRVAPGDVAKKGEFAGYREVMSRMELIRFMHRLPTVQNNAHRMAMESGGGTGTSLVMPGNSSSVFYTPTINNRAFNDAVPQGDTDWAAWFVAANGDAAKAKIQYRNSFEVTTLYARIIPEEFNMQVPGRTAPQIWKFVIVNEQVVIHAERQTNAHDLLPMNFFQPYDDGLSYQTKSLADNVCPIQDVTSALMNANLAARRRGISDRMLYDPSRVDERHINSSQPTAKIPVRPAAYGKPLGEAVYPFPFADTQFQFNNAEMQTVMSLANVISGQNPARQGQFVKGNKTKEEFDTTMMNSNGRDQLVAMSIEATLMMPIKTIIKANILQYQGGTKVLNRDNEQVVEIDPVGLRQAMIVFKVSDGLIPSTKLIDGDTLAVAMQVLGSSPAISSGYNIAPLFSFLMKSRGAKLKEFEKSPEQMQFEQAMGQWQQQIAQILDYAKSLKTPFEEVMTAIKGLPQPKPEDYKFDPSNPRASLTSKPNAQGAETSILQQAIAASSSGGQAAQTAPSTETPTE